MKVFLLLCLAVLPTFSYAGVTRVVMEGVAATSNTIYVDTANVRVGIGNAAPTVALDVTGTAKATAFSGPLTGTVTGTATEAIHAATATRVLDGGVNFSTITTALAGKLTAPATFYIVQSTDYLINPATFTILSGPYLTAPATFYVVQTSDYLVAPATFTYQVPGNYITALTGNVTASGPGSVAATIVSVPASAVDLSTVTTAINLKLSSPTVTGNTGDVLTITNGDFSWQPAPSAAGLTYMFTSSASAISGYTQLVSAVNFMPSQRSTVTVTNPSVGQYISSRCTNVGYPGVTSFPAGTWSNYITLLASNNNRFKVKPEVYLRTAAGVERDYVETFEESEFITTSELPYTLHGIGVATNTLITDLLCVKLKVTVASGAGSITIYSDGTGISYTGARIEGPSVAASVANFVPYSGAVKPLDMGVHSITASSITATGAVTVSTLTVTGANGEFGVKVSSNLWVVGYSSAAKYYGDGSALTGIVAGLTLAQIQASSGSYTGTSTFTSTGNVYYGSGSNLTGQANSLRVSTATYLATAPGACTAGQFISGLTADGTKTCGTPSGAGDVVLAATQTFTGANTFQSTVTLPTRDKIVFGNQIHNSSASFVTTTQHNVATWGPCVNGSTVSITTTGSPVFIGFSGDGANNTLYGIVRMGLMRNGVAITDVGITQFQNNQASIRGNLSFTFVDSSVTAGTHTYCLLFKPGINSEIAYVPYNSEMDNAQFWVMELR